MATIPTKPTVPPAPLRTEPETFASRAAAMVAFFQPFVDYMESIGLFTEEQAQAATAAVIAENIPNLDLSVLAGKGIGVNAGGTQIVGLTIPTLPAFASQDQAEAGTDELTVMNPLRTLQAIEEFGAGGYQYITSRQASGGVIEFTSSDFDNDAFAGYQFVCQSIIPTAASSNFRVAANSESAVAIQAGVHNITNGIGYSAILHLFIPSPDGPTYVDVLSSRTQGSSTSTFITDTNSYRITPLNPQSGTPTALLSSLTFSFATGDISSGVIAMYGMRK